MGSVVSYRGGYDVNRAEQKHRMGGSRSRRRRDSYQRPVLKLHINTGTFERNQRINGQTSLDHPFLRRISKRRFESVDLTASSQAFAAPPVQNHPSSSSNRHPRTHSSSSHHSIPSHTSIASSASINTDQSGFNTPRCASGSSTSMIVVKFIENSNQPGLRPSQHNSDGSQSKPDSEHLCLCDYGRVQAGIDDDETMGTLVFSSKSSDRRDPSVQFELDELKKRIMDHIDPFENLPDSRSVERRSRRYTRSRSTDVLSLVKIEDNLTPREPRILRSQSMTDTQDYATMNVEIELDQDGWTFGESIMRSLEAEGITLFDVVNPQTKSDKEVDRTWPELKNKLKLWRSQQSIVDLDDDIKS